MTRPLVALHDAPGVGAREPGTREPGNQEPGNQEPEDQANKKAVYLK